MQIDEEYFNSEEFRELLEDYEEAAAAGEHPFIDADDLTDIADYYSWKGDMQRAADVIDYALELFPESVLPNVFKARQALLEQNFDAARQYADNIADKDDPDYHYLVAEIMIAEGQDDKADEYLRDYGRTINADEYQDFVKDCANLFVDYDISEKAYEWMMRSRGDDSDDFKELMARTLFGLGKYKDSERLFNELIDRQPFSKHYWNGLASAQFMNEDYSAAVSSSEYAIAIDPEDADAIGSKAGGLLRLGNYEEALRYFRKYSELEPDDAYGLLHQGVCLASMDRNSEAVEVLETAVGKCDDDPSLQVQVFQELAFCYGNAGKPDKALDMLARTETLDCDHADVQVIKGHILLQNGLVEQAEEAYSKAISMSDSSPVILLRIIVSLYDNHYVSACYQMLVKFLDMIRTYFPDFRGGYAYMALCCYDLGRSEEYVKYVQMAVGENPQEARTVLACLFPEGTPVDDYVRLAEQQTRKP